MYFNAIFLQNLGVRIIIGSLSNKMLPKILCAVSIDNDYIINLSPPTEVVFTKKVRGVNGVN